MSKPPPPSSTTIPRTPWSRAAVLLAVASISGATFAAADAGPLAAACVAAPSMELALQRLNDARASGAVCHRPGGSAVAASLRWSERLAAVAAAQAQDMAERGEVAHVDSRHRDLSARLDAKGYRFSAAAENLAVGYDTLDAVIEAWLGSESHCDNLMSAHVLEFGLSCQDGSGERATGERRYWTLVLGAPSRPR